jgi:hypothetical protein
VSTISSTEPSPSSRAMLCMLSISTWSARKHDPEASEEIAQRHSAQADAGRYHKVLLPKATSKSRFFAALKIPAKTPHPFTPSPLPSPRGEGRGGGELG